MTVHTICDRCGMEFEGGVTVNGNIYCCMGCATGGVCTCGSVVVTDDAVVTTGDTVVVDTADTVIVRNV